MKKQLLFKVFLLVSSCFFVCLEVNGQASTYAFSTATGASLNLMTGSTQLLGTGQDDVASSVTNIGFTFNFGCTNYTQFSVSSNGVMGFGATVVSSSLSNSTTGSSTYPIIMPLWDDMHTGTNGKVHYVVSGTSPNRVLTVEWLFRNYSESTPGSFTKKVQVKLYETTNVIEIVYDAGTNPSSASIGIASSSSSYHSVTVSSNTSSTITANDANATFPATGRKYTFTPGSLTPAVPGCATLNTPTNGDAVNVCPNGTTLSWFAPALSGCNAATGYDVYFNSGSSPTTLVSSNQAGTTYNTGALTGSTGYCWKIVPKNATGTSTCSSTVFTFTTTSACPYPGGVSSGLTTWLKADNATSISGSPVSSWASTAGSPGITLSQATASQRPILNTGATNYKLFSYMPQIGFSSSTQSYLNNTALPSDLVGSTGVIFYIGDKEATGITVLTYYYGTNKYQFKPNFRVQTSSDGFNGYTFDFGAPTEYSNLAASEISCFGAGSNQKMRYNSLLNTTCNNCNSSTYNPAVSSGYFLGANGGSEFSNNEVAEVITYNAALATTDVEKIETYLSIKYGITRGGNTGTSATYNYVASDGTIIWNKTTNTGFNYDIAGIGRDDASSLNKKQSISVNNNEPVTIGLNTISTENSTNGNTFGNDKSFLIWGNNGLACTSNYNTTTYASISLPATIQARIQRIWKVQATNFGGIGAGDSYKVAASPLVKVGFETSMLTAYAPISNLRLLVDDDGTNWGNATVVSGATLNGTRVEFPGVQFSASQKYFTLATINYSLTPLPIELLSFNAGCQNGNMLLKWQTLSETNNSHFNIERSVSGVNFETIGTLAGHANSTQINSYVFTDFNAPSGQLYYRLKQIDYDGTARNYNIIDASNKCDNLSDDNLFSVYPNPTNGSEIYLKYSVEKDEDITVRFYDVLGKIISSQRLTLSKESNETTLQINDLAKGVYLIAVQSNQLKRKPLKLIIE